jgi:adenylate cyclase
MSNDPEQEYFSDGLTEDIITALSHWRSFPVIARNSTFVYKARAVRVQEVAKELGARYVLEGSVRKAGDRIRVNAQLVDAQSGHHVWAEKFDRALTDVFQIQDEITQQIAAVVIPELAQAEVKKAELKRPESLSAWDFYLRGMTLLEQQTCDSYRQAREKFRQAVELDPGYGEAWAGLGWSHLHEIGDSCCESREDSLAAGLEAAKKAIELDENSALAHYVLGTAYVWLEQLSLGLAMVEKALVLNPFHAQANMALGNRLDLIGRTAEGIARMERSLELNPRDVHRPTYMAYLSRAQVSAGNFETALEWIDKAYNLRPDNPDLQYRRAVCLAHLDRVDEARAALKLCERSRPGYLADRADWQPYSDAERNRRFFEGLVRNGLRD